MLQTPDFSKEKENFAVYYENKVLPSLQAIEKMRKKYFRRFVLISILTILWCACLFVNVKMTDTVKINMEFASIATCALILFVCLPMLSYYKRSKESLLPVLAGFFGKFSYVYKSSISESLLQQSMIMKPYDLIDTDDCFEGTYDSVHISLTEYNLCERRIERKSGYSRETYRKKGHGIIFNAEMNKNFNSQTIVVKDKGIFNRFSRYKNMQKVGLESPEFEKAFEVYSDNQIIARYILTTVMLEYMLKLKNIFPKIEFSFFASQVLINIEVKQNLFECSSFFRTVINKKRIEENFYQLYLLFSIVKILHLNQKVML